MTFGAALKTAFAPYRLLKAYGESLLDALLLERTVETARLDSLVQTNARTGQNVLVVGRTGVGKTTFVQEYLRRHGRVPAGPHSRIPLEVVSIDLADDDTNDDLQLLKARIGSNVHDYLHKVAPALTTAITATSAEPERYYPQVVAALQKLSMAELRKQNSPALVIFIDDVDYSAVDFQKSLLKVLLPFLQMPQTMVVYAARPPAARLIDHHEDTRIRRLFHPDSIVQLRALPVRELVQKRLSLLLQCGQQDPDRRMVQGRNLLGALESFVGLAGVGQMDLLELVREVGLDGVPYPFTPAQETLLLFHTNGNISDIFDTASAILVRALQEYRTSMAQMARSLDWSYGIPLDTADFVDILQSESIQMSGRLVNIHELYSDGKGGRASIVKDLLELLYFGKNLDDEGMRILAQAGHDAKKIQAGIERAINRELIEDYLGLLAGYSIAQATHSTQQTVYKLTPRGRYYVNHIQRWRRYIETFGEGGRSLIDVQGFLGQQPVVNDILDLLSAIVAHSAGEGGYLYLNKKALYELFVGIFGGNYIEQIDYPERTGWEARDVMSSELFDKIMLDRALSISSEYHAEGDSFRVKPKRVRELARERCVASTTLLRISAEELEDALPKRTTTKGAVA